MYKNLALSENGFLFDSRTGNTFSLNSTGTFLLQELIRGSHPDELVERVTEKFDVSDNEASRDVEQFLFRLKELQVTATEEDEL